MKASHSGCPTEPAPKPIEKLSRAEILLRVQTIARDLFSNPEIQLVDGGTVDDIPDWDSAGHVQIMVAIEEDFGIYFGVEELGHIANLGDLVDSISVKLALRPG